jgi:CO/xanthine dehydrogenase FAD-binding subunit
MRGTAASMTVLRPKSAREALKVYAGTPDALPFVGGTDLMVLWNLGELNDRVMLDLSRISEWSRIERIAGKAGKDAAVLRIGALATHTSVLHHAMVRRHFSLLADACATIGGLQIQNRGTLGGNIANASPAGDTFPPLAVYDARIHIVSASGPRVVPFLDIFAGVKKTTLGAGELIEAIDLPMPKPASLPTRQFFRKVGTRAAQAISKTVAAGALWLNADGTVRDVRLALGSMAPTVRRLRTIEAALLGQHLTQEVVQAATARIGDDVSPIDDVRSTSAYRLSTSQRLLEAFLLDRNLGGQSSFPQSISAG